MSGKDLAKGGQGMVDIRKHANLLVVAVQEWRFVELFRSVCKETVGSTLPKLTCRIDANLNPRTYDCRVSYDTIQKCHLQAYASRARPVQLQQSPHAGKSS